LSLQTGKSVLNIHILKIEYNSCNSLLVGLSEFEPFRAYIYKILASIVKNTRTSLQYFFKITSSLDFERIEYQSITLIALTHF